MNSNYGYMMSLIGALRHEAKKDTIPENSEALRKTFAEFVETVLLLDKENIEMLYVIMLVLNSFLKDKHQEKKGW
ncbi:hypothetical protein ABEX47_17465 [Paenibacillus ehimensis]|uniref:hypothetical protein n=1 Tax=Paenibacillus ehimensis TaxID=79264 RepID=UPI002D14BF95|nr:hypothetical protein [Bacillus sp. (in: firmicutes)]